MKDHTVTVFLAALSLVALMACGDASPDAADVRADVTAADATSTADTPADAGPGGGNDCAHGQTVFDETVVHEVRLELSEADWQNMILEAQNSPEYGGPPKTYFEATLEFDGEFLESPLAIRLKGHSSLLEAAGTGNGFPFKVDLNRVDGDQELDGLSAFLMHPNLDGITAVNEYLSYGAIRAHGIPTAQTGFARVFVNGESLGLYSLVEHIRGDFVRCHYPEPYGDLYKPEEPVGNLAWRGDRIEDYGEEMEFKWPRESVSGHASLLELLSVLRAGDIRAFESVLHISEVLSYLAVNVALGNYDYYASFGHNYYLYEANPGQFTMVPWDMNFSQGEMDEPCGLGRNSTDWPISHWLLADQGRTQQYLDLMSVFLAGPASIEQLNTQLDAAVTLLGNDLDAYAVDELRGAITTRVEALNAAIAAGIEVCPVGDLEEEGDACELCVEGSCETELETCFADPDCDCVAECVFEDTDEDVCVVECDVAAAPTEFDQLIECIIGSCAAQCD